MCSQNDANKCVYLVHRTRSHNNHLGAFDSDSAGATACEGLIAFSLLTIEVSAKEEKVPLVAD